MCNFGRKPELKRPDWDRPDYEVQDPDEHWFNCPKCGSIDFEYVGEVYDEDEFVGSKYHCRDCGHNFVADVGEI